MRSSNVIVRGIGDLATSAVGAVAGAATSTAGVLSGGAVGGGVGALSGVARGLTQGVAAGAARGRHSTAATVITLTAVGVSGLVDWPILLATGGAAIVLDKAINRHPGERSAASGVAAGEPARPRPARRPTAPSGRTQQRGGRTRPPGS